MIIMSAEREALETYKEIAGTIVNQHVQTLSTYHFPDKDNTAAEFIRIFNHEVKNINDELALNAERILANLDYHTDYNKLKELLFVIRKDYFNEFLKKCEACLQ